MLQCRAIVLVSLSFLAACGDASGSGDTTTDTAVDPDAADTADTSQPQDTDDPTDSSDTTPSDTRDTSDASDTSDTSDTRDTDTADVQPVTSCEGRCGLPNDPSQACQCDALCLSMGNCCADFEAVCGTPCEDPSLTRCGDTCVDTATSTDFCGSCETPCDDKGNQATSCAGGECTRTCLPGFLDCNLDPSDGCEAELARDPEHCGSCEKFCDSGPFGAPACRGGQCVLACNPGRGACNDVSFDGCETDLTSSEDNCGYCGVTCPVLPNTAPQCAASGCETSCLEGFEDCDGVVSNGCEADLLNASSTCGACDVACGPSETCTQGGCACTGAFGYLFPPTSRLASSMADDGFAFALTCNLAETSIDDPALAVIGAQGGASVGTLTRQGGNGLAWSTTDPFLAGDEVDITIGAGFRSFDSLKSSAARVIKARVAVSSAGSGTFVAGQTVNPGTYLGQVVLGDFDGDGDLDLVTDAYNLTTQIKGTFHLNDGVEFGATVGDPDQDNFQRLAVHDFNRDGRADLLVMNNAAGGFGTTKVLWGAAQNPLTTGTNLTTIGGQMSPAIGDIDGDGDLDLVIGRRPGASGDQAGVRFAYDSLTNTFASLGAISANAADPFAAALVDVDDDGDLDLFQGNGSIADRVYTNNGSGTFTAGTTYGAAATEPSGVEVGDVNGDGFPDVLVVNRNAADKIYLGSSTGAFTETNAPNLAGVEGALGGQVRLADIDGDGDLDIVGITAGKLALYTNDGAGTFSGGGTAFNSIGFAVGDLDGDGDLDIANIGGASAGVTILKNVCTGDSCTCGNGALNGKEACDDGPNGSAFCDPDCTLRRCGDGYLNTLGGEQCDDGNDDDTDACRTNCVLATCADGRANQGESDVDCGGPCATKCAASAACLDNGDCQSGLCVGFVCAYKADFEGGLPPEFSTGPSNPWVLDATTPISNSAHSLISHDFNVQGTNMSGFGTSSVFLTATFGAGGGRLVYDVQTNCSYASVLTLRIDGVKVVELYGRRLQLDNGYTDSYDLPAGTHTFEWRYESKIGTAQGLLFPPYHRAWIDNVVLINGAP